MDIKMFRNYVYVNESLDLPQYNQMMLKAPKNQKYCNAYCQKFIDTNEFYEGESSCKECFNHIKAIRKMLGDKYSKKSAEEIMLEFEKNLDELVEGLEQMKPEDSIKYNKKQIVLIAKKLGIKFYQTQDKPIIMELIDTHLQKKKEDEKQSILKDLGGEITLNGISVLSREDGFINATAMCKAGNKKFNDWLRSESSKELIKALEEAETLKKGIPVFKNCGMGIPIDENPETGIPVSANYQVIDIKKGGNDKKAQGSWIHPDLAVQLAQWISPIFSLEVSKWIRELALCGSVTIGKEKTSQQLLELQKDFKKLEEKHRKLLQKKQYYKFKEGPAFYIISDIDGKSVKFKPGFEGVDIDIRLQQHRSTTPGIKLEYLIYSKDASLIETTVLKRFESKRKLVNHEWIFDVDVNYIIKSTRTILDILNIEYIEEKSIEEYNNQIISDFC